MATEDVFESDEWKKVLASSLQTATKNMHQFVLSHSQKVIDFRKAEERLRAAKSCIYLFGEDYRISMHNRGLIPKKLQSKDNRIEVDYTLTWIADHTRALACDRVEWTCHDKEVNLKRLETAGFASLPSKSKRDTLKNFLENNKHGKLKIASPILYDEFVSILKEDKELHQMYEESQLYIAYGDTFIEKGKSL